MQRLIRATVASLLFACATARAEVYLGGAVVNSSYQYSDVGSGTGSDLFLGYRVDGLPLMLEVSAFDAGHPKINDYTDPSGDTFKNGKLGFKGTKYCAGYFGSQPRLKLGYWGKLGYWTGKARLSGTATISGTPVSVDNEQSGNGLAFGLGAQYMFTPWFGAMLQFEGYENVNDFQNFDDNHKGAVTFFGAGLVLAFPPFRERSAPPSRHHEPRKPAPRPQPIEPAPAPLPATVAPAPAAVPPAAATSPGPTAPPAQPATRPASGEVRTLPAGFLLRGRPSADADGVVLEADTLVTLATRLEKAEGAWWFVRSEKRLGWVLEQELPAR